MGAAVSHLVGEASDSPLVLAFEAELVAGEEPLGALAGAAGLDVGGLLAGLPAAGDDDGALDGRALLAVDVLGVAETQRLKVLAGEADVALGPVERHGHAAGVVDVGDLSAGAVLDPGLSWWSGAVW